MAAAQKKKGKKLLLWLAFSVIFALGPLFVNFLLVRDKPDFNWAQLYNRGELLLVSAALCADAVGRLFNLDGERSYFVILCLIGAVYLLFTSSVEFGMAAPGIDAGLRLTPKQVHDSVYQFAGTVFAGLGSVLAED
jgi:hypothetical protein